MEDIVFIVIIKDELLDKFINNSKNDLYELNICGISRITGEYFYNFKIYDMKLKNLKNLIRIIKMLNIFEPDNKNLPILNDFYSLVKNNNISILNEFFNKV